MYKEKRNILLTIFLFLQIGAVIFLSYYPKWIDQYYVNGFYPVISRLLRYLFGWVPFSVGDLIYGVLIILICVFLWKLILRKGSRRLLLLEFMAGLSIFFFCFYLFWGLNYSRSPIQKPLGLDDESFDIIKLQEVSEKILFKTILLHQQLSEHDTLGVEVPYSKKQILEKTALGYKALGSEFAFFEYEKSSLKNSLFSLPLTYMGFSGYFNPLSGEAQVDHLIPKVSLPFTCSHEVAHQLGIASESEANFVGFLASIKNEDPYFQYAAYMLALRYALFDIRRYDQDLFEGYVDRIPSGIIKNFRETDDFWRRYENPLEPLFKAFYDHYLKFNQQKDGLESYNQIMGLIISYDKIYGLNI